MTKGLFFAVSVGCLSLLFEQPSHSRVILAAQSAPMPVAAVGPSASPGNLPFVLTGTAVGPRVDLEQFGASTLVEAGSVRLLFDCGRGATLRLAQVGVPIGLINRLFLTHLHSDHVIQIPDLFLTGWGGGMRRTPLEVWGPTGTVAMMAHMQETFAFDIHMRRDVDEKTPGDGIKVDSHDIKKEGIVFDDQGVKVTAFLVDHGPVSPAFGYRVDYRGHSVVLGDTRASDNLVRFAKGVDVLVHEVVDPDVIRASGRPNAEAIIDHHTTPEDAGELFARVKPRLAVYSHAPNTEAVITKTRKTYTGPLQGPEDMLTIDIGDQVNVRHFKAK